MKTGSMVCVGLFVAGAVLLMLQMWFELFSGVFFVKLMVTIGVGFVVVLGVTLVHREYWQDKHLRKHRYIE